MTPKVIIMLSFVFGAMSFSSIQSAEIKDLIVKVKPISGHYKLKGRDYENKFSIWAKLIEKEYGLKLEVFPSGKLYKSFSPEILKKLKEQNKTESELFTEIIRKRSHLKGKKPVIITGDLLEKWSGVATRFIVRAPATRVDQILAEGNREIHNLNFSFYTNENGSLDSNDAYFNFQWPLQNIGQFVNGSSGDNDADIDGVEAWDLTMGSPEATLAILDTGYAIEHPELGESVWINQGELKIENGNFPAGLDFDNDGFVLASEVLNYITDYDNNGSVDLRDLNHSNSPFVNGLDLDGNSYVDDLIGWNAYSNNRFVQDSYGHGTRVGAPIGMKTNNGGEPGDIGAGLASGLSIMPIKVTDFSSVPQNRVSDGLLYAIASGVDAISMSFSYSFQPIFHEEIQIARDAGIFLASSAGNEGNTQMRYPAAFPEVMGVAGINNRNERRHTSSYGDWVSIAGPGEGVLSLNIATGSIGFGSGTSMATPYVAATAAMMRSLNPELMVVSIESILESTATAPGNLDPSEPNSPPGLITGLGAGVLNVFEALDAVPDAPCVGDFNHDRMILKPDLDFMMTAYHSLDQAADLNGDGFIGESDIMVLVNNWGSCD